MTRINRSNRATTRTPDKANWYRIDLHLHTPASRDYQESGATYLDILKKAEAEGLDAIAFTDHNTVAGYGAMRQEISDLTRWEQAGRLRPDEQARLDEYRRLLDKILVLPGMELTATFGFHILAVFDPDTPVRSLEHVLLRLNVPLASLDTGETEVGSTSDVLTAYQVMAEAGGLVIAAHVNSSHGVAMFGLDFGGQTRIAYTQDPHLHALEVTDLEGGKRRSTASFFSGSKPEYSRRMHCIQGSDAHRLRGKGKDLGVGERATEMLLPELTFKALLDLFAGVEFTRTRPYRHEDEAPFDHVAAARQQGPNIVQSFHESASKRGGLLHRVLCDVVAYANTGGGTIYVGAGPQVRVPPRGVDNPEAAMAELRVEIEHNVTPPLDIKFSLVKSQDKDIIRIVVPKGEDVPYVLEGSQIYVRQEAESSLALRDEIVALVTRASRPAAEAVASVAAAPALTVTPPVPSSMGAPTASASQPRSRSRSGSSRGGRRAPLVVIPPPGVVFGNAAVPADLAEVEPAPLVPQASEAEQVDALVGEMADSVLPSEKQSEQTPMASAASAQVSSSTPVPIAGGIEPPRTGVEIAETVLRKGVQYHAMRDLRDGNLVHNVSRASARRLWRYAIALKEKGTFQDEMVTWVGDLGLWHKYLRSGRPHYDLVQRLGDGGMRVYYGVSEDGIHGPWREVVGIVD